MDNQENNQSDLQELQPGDDLSVDFDDLNVELTDPDPGAAGLDEVSDLSAPTPLPGEHGSDLDDGDPEELEPVALSEEELENILGDSDVQDVLAAPIEEEDVQAHSEPAAVFEDEIGEPPALEDSEAPGDVPVDDDIFLNDGDLELDDADLQLDEPDADLPELGADDLLTDEPADFNSDEIDTSDELDIHDIEELEMPDELMDSGDGDTETLPPLNLDDEDDEPVTLSEDELGNILDDVEPSDEIKEGDSAPADFAGDMSGDDADEEEDILSLTDDEPLGDVSAEPAMEADMPSALAGDDDEDESITLSDEELSRVLLDTDEMDVADASSADAPPIPDLDDVSATGAGDESSFEVDMTQDEPQASADEPIAPSLTSLDMDDDDEPITLTAEELGNIVSDTEEEAVDAPAEIPPDDELDLAPDMSDMGSEPAAVSILDGDDDDEPVALSENELANILEDVDDAEPIEATGMQPVDEMGEPADGDSPVIVLDEYDDSAKDDDSGVAAGVAAGAAVAATAAAVVADDRADSPVVAETAAEKGVDIQEMKKMISYLDGLFDKLPDDTVREFSRSEYFDLYKKIMGELGL